MNTSTHFGALSVRLHLQCCRGKSGQPITLYNEPSNPFIYDKSKQLMSSENTEFTTATNEAVYQLNQIAQECDGVVTQLGGLILMNNSSASAPPKMSMIEIKHLWKLRYPWGNINYPPLKQNNYGSYVVQEVPSADILQCMHVLESFCLENDFDDHVQLALLYESLEGVREEVQEAYFESSDATTALDKFKKKRGFK